MDYGNPQASKPPSSAFWAKEAVLSERGLEYRPGSIFLGRVDQKLIGFMDTRHIVTLAGSGGGKTACVLIPNLRLYPGSCLVIDPKGELARATAQQRAAMGQAVKVIDPWGVAFRDGDDGTPGLPAGFDGSLDPLKELAADPDNLTDNAALIADALIIGNEKDSFWTDAGKGLVRCFPLWAFMRPSLGLTLGDFPALLAQVAASLSLKPGETPGLLQRWSALDPADGPADQILKNQADYLLGLDERPRSSILATVKEQLQFLESPAMGRALAASALTLADLKTAEKGATVYLCLPASRMGTHARWLRLIINLALASMERVPARPDAVPVLLVLEEFAALGHMKALERAVAYLRSFKVRVWAVLQDLTQLKRDYKDGWETFLGNAGVIQAFSVVDHTTQDHLCKMIGRTTIVITNKQDVGTSAAMAGDTGLRREFRTENLMDPDEIGRFFSHTTDADGRNRGGSMLVKIAGKAPFIVDRVHHSEILA
jgi:type IV secretion system protein VirD4